MLTPVERVLILKGADLLNVVGPRQLLRLAEVSSEVEMWSGDLLYDEKDPADALYLVVEGRVRLVTGGSTPSEVGPGEAFGTWALVDDSERGQQATCVEDGVLLALRREDFYDVADGDLTLLKEVVRALAKRLRALVSERPEEARVEPEGIDKPEALTVTENREREAAAFPVGNAAPTDGAPKRASSETSSTAQREIESSPEIVAPRPMSPVEPEP